MVRVWMSDSLFLLLLSFSRVFCHVYGEALEPACGDPPSLLGKGWPLLSQRNGLLYRQPIQLIFRCI